MTYSVYSLNLDIKIDKTTHSPTPPILKPAKIRKIKAIGK